MMTAQMKKVDLKTSLSLSREVVVVGHISSSQDGVVVDRGGVSPTHTAGHGNCPKVTVVTEN